ncbi:hypothetical protein [Paraburkholderia caffeinilytica]|uniref:hypothetical protein n=1 Tax=Paraburkholderia caffeinilytica TaxID=1761016 RepID=UPI0038B816E9
MAIRNRAAWDMSAAEIDRRAKEVKVDNYFARQQPQQVRADSAAAADKAILDALSKTMSPDQLRDTVLAYSRAIERGENFDLASFVRADAVNVSQSDGLRQIVNYDQMGRPHSYTYENTTGRKLWLDKYRAPLMEMVQLNKYCIPQDRFPEVEARWRADRERKNQIARDLAAGKDVRFTDFESGERMK